MVIYDFKYTAKKLIPLYLFMFVLQIFFSRVEKSCGFILSIGLLITAAVNLNKFWNDYMGKSSVMINMLPVGEALKVFSKLLWGFVYSVLYIGLITFAAFRGLKITISVFGFLSILLFYLNCYAAMSTAKYSGRWYYIFGLMVLLNGLTFLICSAVNYLFGGLAAAVVYIVFCIILFFVNMYFIEK